MTEDTALGFFLIMPAAGRRISDWEVTALAAIMIVGIFDLTCYYSFMVLCSRLIEAVHIHADDLLDGGRRSGGPPCENLL